MRWVPNPRYAGDMAFKLPSDLAGAIELSFGMRPGERASATEVARPQEPDPWRDPARFRVLPTNEVEISGTIVNREPDRTSGRTVVFLLPDGLRPGADVDFDVACQTGFTTVTVQRGGALVADPGVGPIDLRGVRFAIA